MATAFFIIMLLLASSAIQMLYFLHQNRRALASLKSMKKRKGRIKHKQLLLLQE
jgi:cell division protein FtsL